tara:strand:+ start:28 stop:1011 length:984 start_codon:yes stop_codon:yes gene_type:complete
MAHTKRLKTFHLFAGAGGGILADLLLGHIPIGACEIEPYPRNVLLQRQRDGVLPSFPVWDDINTLDGTPWRGSIDVLAGGFPCQDISSAGKGTGITGARSGLWKEYARVIGEMRPKFVFAENSPLLRTRGLGVVLKDLAQLGYDARWGIIGAGDVGAPHKRKRMWVLAYAKELQCNGGDDNTRISTQPKEIPQSGDGSGKNNLAYADSSQRKGSWISGGVYPKYGNPYGESAWWGQDPADLPNPDSIRQPGQGLHGGREHQETDKSRETDRLVNVCKEEQDTRLTQPFMGRVAHGVANRVDKLKSIGNGQVPQCAAMAFNTLSDGLI